MKELKIVELIQDAISNHRTSVVDTMNESNVSIESGMSDRQIFDLLNFEVNQGNKLLANNFGVMLTELYDFSPLVETEKSSNFNSDSPDKKSVLIVGLGNKRKKIDLI